MVKATFQILTVVTLLFCIFYCTGEAAKKKAPIILDEETWVKLLDGEWLVDFYAPWCPACKKLEPEWRQLAEWSDDLNIKVASSDVTINPGLSGRFMVSGLPTIFHVKDGIFRQYTGSRDHKALINFIEKQDWMKIEPISKWRAPNSLQMSIVAYAFRISLTLRDVHNYLVEEIGLPYYISYLIFALCTVTLGTILGLLIVFIIDQFYPPRSSGVSSVAQASKVSVSDKKKKSKKSSDDGEGSDDTNTNENKPLRRRVKQSQ